MVAHLLWEQEAGGSSPPSPTEKVQVKAVTAEARFQTAGHGAQGLPPLATIMRAAVRDGCIARSPVEVKGAPKEPSHEQPVATVAEVGSLAEAVPAQYRAMVVMAAWCGLRFGELAALRRDRIDLLHGNVRVAETVTELASGERFAGPP